MFQHLLQRWSCESSWHPLAPAPYAHSRASLSSHVCDVFSYAVLAGAVWPWLARSHLQQCPYLAATQVLWRKWKQLDWLWLICSSFSSFGLFLFLIVIGQIFDPSSILSLHFRQAKPSSMTTLTFLKILNHQGVVRGTGVPGRCSAARDSAAWVMCPKRS